MIKQIVCYFLMLCSFMLCGMDDDKNEYVIHLKDGEIRVEKQLLDKFPGSSGLLSESGFIRSYTVNAFQLAMDVAQIMSPDVFSKLPEKINFETKSKIVQKLEKSLLPDILGCKKIFFHLQQSDDINKFLNQEAVRLFKKFFFQTEEDIDLTDIEDVEDETSSFKSEIVRIFATSDEISDFSQQNVPHIDLPSTKDKEILCELMVPHGSLYAYTTTGDWPVTYLFNLADRKKILYKLPEVGSKPYASSLYAAQFANKIVGLTPPGVAISFSDKGHVEVVFVGEDEKKALSKDGKFFLMMSVIGDKCYLYVHDLINKGILIHERAAYISKSRKLGGCCFNPEDSDIFLYYTDEEVCVSGEQYLRKPMILNNFDGEIIKAAFSDDGSCIYILTWQTYSLTCYKYHYLEQVGKIKISHPGNINIVDLVNSFDNDQLFVVCSYAYPSKLYDLIRFDFEGDASKHSAHNLVVGAKQKLDVRLLGNLIVYKEQGKIHFYDAFFRKPIMYPFGLDRCRSILGFSAQRFLWFRIESPVDSRSINKKSADDYLLYYKVQKEEKLKEIADKIEENFDLNDCLELLRENRDNRKLWYKNAYDKLDKDVKKQKQSLKKTDVYAEAYKKTAILQSTQSEQTKAIIETKKSLQRAQEERRRQQEKLITLKVLEERKKKQQKDDERRLKTIQKFFGGIPGQTQASQTPQLTFVQRIWLNVKSAVQTVFNFIVAPFRWAFGYV